MQNWIIEELMYEQRRHALDRVDMHVAEAKAAYEAEHHGLRGIVASTLVRVGMTLDQAAGQRAATTLSR